MQNAEFRLRNKVLGLTILIDQASKYWITVNNVPYIYNEGVAFSLPLGNKLSFLIGILLVTLLLIFSNKMYQGAWKKLFQVSFGLVIGGAISNIIDRLHAPGVIDFIKIPYWPTFNFADVAVCSGIGILIVLLYLDSKQQS